MHPARPEAKRLIDLQFVRGWFGRYWLAVWFAVISAIRLSSLSQGPPGWDAALYLEATRRWLAGIDPWSKPYDTQWFAAPPTSLVPLVPIAVLPPEFGLAAMLGLSVAAAVATVLLLRLPWWWLLFPPLVDGAWTANPHMLVVPLILLRAGWLATVVKTYAVVPLLLLGRWRQLTVAAFATAATAPLLPWPSFFSQLPQISARLADQSDGGLSATAVPILVPIALVALAFAGRRRAAWLAVPAMWPSTQWYYSTLALPGLTWLAAAVASVPVPGAGVVSVILVAWAVRRGKLDATAPPRTPAPDPQPAVAGGKPSTPRSG